MGLSFLEKFISFVQSHRPAMALSFEGILAEVMISPEVVTLPAADLRAITAAAKAFETLRQLPAYRAWVKEANPPDHIANFDPGYGTIFDCLDFHSTPTGPKLIEINTNASGAPLSTLVREFQGFQNQSISGAGTSVPPFEAFRKMIFTEWTAYCQIAQTKKIPARELKHIAIVDTQPEEQRTFFEFKMYQSLFKEWGIQCSILDPSQITEKSGRLTFEGEVIDLIYNRLTDFYLDDPAHTLLRTAYMEMQVCLTPNPYGYSLMADKERLIGFSQDQVISGFGLPPEDLDAIRAVTLKTTVLTKENAKDLWEKRKGLFFKPQRSYGGKSAYKGASISKGPFERMTDGSSIAQELAEPGKHNDFKYDLRVYTHQGVVLLVGVRLFQGQLLNFKTVGGGFGAIQVSP